MYTKNHGKHPWHIAHFASVPQVLITKGSDIAHLKELDIKLWTVLAMPTTGLHFDSATLNYLDSDNDKFIRPPELLAAIDWLSEVLTNLDILTTAGDEISLSNIKEVELFKSAQWLLKNIQRNDAKSLSWADIIEQKALFDKVPVFDDNDSMQVLAKKMIEKSGSDTALANIQTDIQAMKAWYAELETKQQLLPLALEKMQAACDALEVVKDKIDDYFVRCALSSYQPTAKTALQPDADTFKEHIHHTLSNTTETIASLPLAAIADSENLDLDSAFNPSWQSAMLQFKVLVVEPFLGKNYRTLSKADWTILCGKLLPYQNWKQAQPETIFSGLDMQCVDEAAKPENIKKIEQSIQTYTLFITESKRIAELEKLVLYRRDIFSLIKNYISFTDFYEGNGAVFQAGTLYFDGRAASLCFELAEDPRHTSLDGLSGAFLMYCDIVRGAEKKKILALFSDGDSASIVVGRNGIFYDRYGKDWNATVTKLIQNPMSVREAFFMPYKKLASMIESQIAKRAQDADAVSNDKLSGVAKNVSTIDKAETQKAVQPVAKKLDLGTIALVGTALGGISALIGSILQALFGLGFWVPLGIAGILLCISGPSMILTSLKLRKRSIGCILEANGWAINKQVRINIPFGRTLTNLAVLPLGSIRSRVDPFAEKRTKQKIVAWVLLLLLLAAAVVCYFLFLKDTPQDPILLLKKLPAMIKVPQAAGK